MGEVVPFEAVSRRSVPSRPFLAEQLPFEMYLAYQQAEEAFRAVYLGRTFDFEAIKNRASAKIVEGIVRRWNGSQRACCEGSPSDCHGGAAHV
jgi:hypothetical protein